MQRNCANFAIKNVSWKILFANIYALFSTSVLERWSIETVTEAREEEHGCSEWSVVKEDEKIQGILRAFLFLVPSLWIPLRSSQPNSSPRFMENPPSRAATAVSSCLFVNGKVALPLRKFTPHPSWPRQGGISSRKSYFWCKALKFWVVFDNVRYFSWSLGEQMLLILRGDWGRALNILCW